MIGHGLRCLYDLCIEYVFVGVAFCFQDGMRSEIFNGHDIL
jgi:hypothetical protein